MGVQKSSAAEKRRISAFAGRRDAEIPGRIFMYGKAAKRKNGLACLAAH